jgi:tetratricopeptide (TPR) repeat protein
MTNRSPQAVLRLNPARLLTLFPGILFWSWFCRAWQPNVCAADVVQVTASDGLGLTHGVEGTVLDYTGRQLTLQVTTGRQRTFTADQVHEVQSEWNKQHQAGNQAWQQEDWQAAISHYRAANRAEPRTWVRREILTQLMRCYQRTGDLAAAGKLFLLIVSSDPETPAYQFIPLTWSTAGGVEPTQAASWLTDSEVPAAMLLGASHLLSTPSHSRALATLDALRRMANQPPAISTLATAQIWRTQAQTASEDEVRRWSQQVETFPEPLRAGPYFVLGVACQRLRQFEQASLFYLRIPILYGDQPHLAARALVAAARLQEPNDRPAAITLLREVVSRYKGTTEDPMAQRLLQDWEK